MSHLKRYDVYKPSGHDWLGHVPAHWTIAPLKRLLDIQNGADHKAVEADEGVPVYGSGGVFAFAKTHLYEGESILLGRKGTIDKPLFVSGRFWTVDTMYWTKIRSSAAPKFAYYVALTVPFDRYSTNTALPSMTKEALNAHKVGYPPISEQAQIANRLDTLTARIDTLIEKKTRFIKLLKEKRQALIAHAVTKGLKPDALMKDSGIEWLREVPAHWSIVPSPWLFDESKERAHDSDEQLSATQKYGVIPRADFERLEGRRVTHATLHLEQRKHAEVDDFVISMRSFEGGIERVKARGCVRSSYVVLRAKNNANVDFYSHLFKSSLYIQGLQATASFIRDGQDLSYANFRQVKLPLPPFEEQTDIALSLSDELVRIDSLHSLTQRSMDLLIERRSALITAAVTGKIDLRDAA